MHQKKILLASLTLLLGCNSKNSNPKDYWTLSEPKIITWESNSGDTVAPRVEKLNSFRSSTIKTTLDYRSHILINNISSDVKFEIKTTCKESLQTNTEIQSQISEINNNNSAVLTKTSILEKSNKIYFYNYLPEQILIDNEYKTSAPDYNCDFEVSAINKINSTHTFKISDIKVNTFAGNFITIDSIETPSKNEDSNKDPIFRTINVNRDVVNIELPSLFYNNPQMNYKMGLKNPDYSMENPSYIQCSGKNNKINLLNQFGDQNPIDILFRLKATDNSTTFLKKCRIVALVNKKAPSDNEALYIIDDLTNSDQLLVWSDYFNVIFEAPKIEIQTRIIESSTNNYPFNYGIHIDARTHVFDLIFTNSSSKRTKLHFSDTQNIKTLLTPLILISQRPNFKKSDTKELNSVFRFYKTNNSFISGLYLTLDSEPLTEFTLNPRESKTVQVHVSKNFKCELPKSVDFIDYPFAEIGFKIQSIPLNENGFSIQASYLNQGQLENYPEKLDLETILQQTKNTIFKGTRGEKEIAINHLQVIENRKFVIDTLILRNLAGETKANYSDSFLDQTQYYIFNDQNGPLNVFNSPLDSDFSGSFCEKVY